MATAEEYATWIVQNRSKQGTPEFETVAQAYQIAKSQQNVAQTAMATTPVPAPSGLGEQLIGAGETGLTLLTGGTTGLLGTIGGGISLSLIHI